MSNASNVKELPLKDVIIPDYLDDTMFSADDMEIPPMRRVTGLNCVINGCPWDPKVVKDDDKVETLDTTTFSEEDHKIPPMRRITALNGGICGISGAKKEGTPEKLDSSTFNEDDESIPPMRRVTALNGCCYESDQPVAKRKVG